MENKIGIITFHRALNYGAVLQTYALYKTIEELGGECEVIDYRNKRIEYRRSLFRYEKKAKIKSIVHSFLTFKSQIQKQKVFQNFLDKNIKFSKKVDEHNIQEIKDDYSKIITGSDQVFSPTCVDFDYNYFYLLQIRNKNILMQLVLELIKYQYCIKKK